MLNSELTGAIIFGGQRVGKTSYALQILYDIYQDWDITLGLCFFRLEDIIGFLRDRIKLKMTIPALLWDDTGVHGNKMLFYTQRTMAEYLQNLFDVIGTITQGILMTTPNPENLLKAIRGYEFHRIKIIKANSNYRRMAKGYKNILLPSGTRRIRRDFEDTFDVRIPNDVYKDYIITRNSYLDSALDNLDEILNRKQREKPDT